jgi:hypothetical protein
MLKYCSIFILREMEVRTVEYIEKPTKTLTDGVYLKEGDSYWRILDVSFTPIYKCLVFYKYLHIYFVF